MPSPCQPFAPRPGAGRLEVGGFARAIRPGTEDRGGNIWRQPTSGPSPRPKSLGARAWRAFHIRILQIAASLPLEPAFQAAAMWPCTPDVHTSVKHRSLCEQAVQQLDCHLDLLFGLLNLHLAVTGLEVLRVPKAIRSARISGFESSMQAFVFRMCGCCLR